MFSIIKTETKTWNVFFKLQTFKISLLNQKNHFANDIEQIFFFNFWTNEKKKRQENSLRKYMFQDVWMHYSHVYVVDSINV